MPVLNILKSQPGKLQQLSKRYILHKSLLNIIFCRLAALEKTFQTIVETMINTGIQIQNEADPEGDGCCEVDLTIDQMTALCSEKSGIVLS